VRFLKNRAKRLCRTNCFGLVSGQENKEFLIRRGDPEGEAALDPRDEGSGRAVERENRADELNKELNKNKTRGGAEGYIPYIPKSSSFYFYLLYSTREGGKELNKELMSLI
jgi:hypothetical protein